MKILILEDNKARIEQFKELLEGNEIWFTYEAQDAIDLLDTQRFDALFLDHDLGGKVFAPSNEYSGYAVATFLERHPDRMPEIIIIHSLNIAGVKRMVMALRTAYILPFVWTGEWGNVLERLGIL